MSKPDNYSIGHDIISKYEKELLDSLPQLYPDEGDRQFIREALIPHFRIKLNEVFEEFLKERSKGRGGKDRTIPISEYETPDLCLQIDKMIQENREFLLMDGLFRPVIGQIQKIRPQVKEELEEETKQGYINALKAEGITDLQSLLVFTIDKFRSHRFPPYGIGVTLMTTILDDKTLRVSKENLEKMADKLDWIETGEQKMQGLISTLKAQCITDRQSLLGFGIYKFSLHPFPPYGIGQTLMRIILDNKTLRCNRGNLEKMAEKLGW